MSSCQKLQFALCHVQLQPRWSCYQRSSPPFYFHRLFFQQQEWRVCVGGWGVGLLRVPDGLMKWGIKNDFFYDSCQLTRHENWCIGSNVSSTKPPDRLSQTQRMAPPRICSCLNCLFSSCLLIDTTAASKEPRRVAGALSAPAKNDVAWPSAGITDQ